MEIQTQKHVKTIGDLFHLPMILKLHDVDQIFMKHRLRFALTDDFLLQSPRLRKVAAIEIAGWGRVEHQSRGEAALSAKIRSEEIMAKSHKNHKDIQKSTEIAK